MKRPKPKRHPLNGNNKGDSKMAQIWQCKISRKGCTMSVLCWDHCKNCGRSQNRFWVKSKKQFEKERAEILGYKCGFCGGCLVSYTDQEKWLCAKANA